MAEIGPLEAIARMDLDALLEEVGRWYRPGVCETLAAADPRWRRQLDAAERELGAHYQTLVEADAALLHWRRAVAEVTRLWRRAAEVPEPVEDGAPLEDVA